MIRLLLVAVLFSFGVNGLLADGPAASDSGEKAPASAVRSDVLSEFEGRLEKCQVWEDFKALTDSLKAGVESGQLSKQMFSAFAEKMVRRINSFDDKPERTELLNSFVLEAVGRPDLLSVDSQRELVVLLRGVSYSPDDPRAKDWGATRRKMVEAWLAARERMKNSIDPNWDPNKMDFYSPGCVPPPLGVQGYWVVGAGAEQIKDENLRTIYQNKVRENSEKIGAYNHQVLMRRRILEFERAMEGIVPVYYYYPPFDILELQNALAGKIGDAQRDRMVKKAEAGVREISEWIRRQELRRRENSDAATRPGRL